MIYNTSGIWNNLHFVQSEHTSVKYQKILACFLYYLRIVLIILDLIRSFSIQGDVPLQTAPIFKWLVKTESYVATKSKSFIYTACLLSFQTHYGP